MTQKVIDGLERKYGVPVIQDNDRDTISPKYSFGIEVPTIGSTITVASSVYPEEDPESEWINGIRMYTQTSICENNRINYNDLTDHKSDQDRIDEWLEVGGVISSHQENLDCLCNYWNHNTVKDEYTYVITDMPSDRETPANYQSVVEAGVQAGLNQWGDINNIKFTQINSKLDANIIIQQQIGDATHFGNAAVGCLLEDDQCTIQLFSDVNVNNRQTLVNKESIEYTIAHEFGHLIGLPHHIDEGHILNTLHAINTRTYYEARNINVPEMYEPTGYEYIPDNTLTVTSTTEPQGKYLVGEDLSFADLSNADLRGANLSLAILYNTY